jgi:hypothetical protein
MTHGEPWPAPERIAAWRPQRLEPEPDDGFTSISVPVQTIEMRAWRGEYQTHFGREWKGSPDLLSQIMGEAGSGAQIFSRMWETDEPDHPRQPPREGRRAMGRPVDISEALVTAMTVLGVFLALCLVAAALAGIFK